MTSDAAVVHRLCGLFAESLELERVEPDTDFFIAGGHSLSALSLTVAVEESFGVRVRVRDLLEAASPRLLADRIAGAVPAGVPKPEPAPEPGPRPEPGRGATDLPGDPVGEAARWLWLERQRGTEQAGAYTVPCLLDGDGPLDVDRLARALATLSRRHPALRTVFVEAMGEPRAVVTDRVVPLEVADLREAGEDALSGAVGERLALSFDPAAGPLVRATVFLRPGGAWSLLVVADHLVCDGRSLAILAEEAVDAYVGRLSTAAVPPAARPGLPEAALDHWRQVLTPPPSPLPLPVSGPRTGPRTGPHTGPHTGPVGAVSAIAVAEAGPDLLDRLARLGGRHHAGPFAPLAAAVARALAGLTGATDICLGTAVDRRSVAGADGAVGFHVATVPLRLEVTAGQSADDLVAQVARRTADAVDHSEVSFDALVAALDPPRVPGRTPFFDVWVALYPHIDTGARDPDGIALRGGPVPTRTGIFELSVQFVEHPGGLRIQLQYDAARYAADTAGRLVRRVRDELHRLLGDAVPTGAAGARPVFGGFRFDA